MPTLNDLLARCPRCQKTVLLVYGRVSYRNLALFEAIPWSPLDEPEPEGLTDNGRKRWLAQLPYKLYICYIDFETGTWDVAMARANEKLRQGEPLWKPHNCLREEDDGDLEPTKADLVPDRPAVRAGLPVVDRDPEPSVGAVADGRVRRRRARPGGARAEVV